MLRGGITGLRTVALRFSQRQPFLIVSSNAKSQPRAREICDAATAAGAKATLIVEDVGAHDFPVSAYPAVRSWPRGAAME